MKVTIYSVKLVFITLLSTIIVHRAELFAIIILLYYIVRQADNVGGSLWMFVLWFK